MTQKIDRRPYKQRSKSRKADKGAGGRSRSRNSGRESGARLARNAPPIDLEITHVGGRGDGVGKARYTHNHVSADHSVFVPGSLPGERVLAQPISINGQGISTELSEIILPSPERRDPDCAVFHVCGGCTLQHWQDDAVRNWKMQHVKAHLQRAKVEPAEIGEIEVSPRQSRRRATFHLKRLQNDVVAGFQERGSSRIITPEGCSVLRPELTKLLDQLTPFAKAHFPVGIDIDAVANCLDNGICLLLRGPAGWYDGVLEALTVWAADHALARLSVADNDTPDPLTLFAHSAPWLRFGEITVTPPPGGFLQATIEAQTVLQNAVAGIIGEAGHVLDLFCGCGTLSLPLLNGRRHLTAVESDRLALAALKSAVDAAGRGAQLTCINADLANAPMMAASISEFDAVILDPPRSGAAAQCAHLADSSVKIAAMVSCNPASFARDAATLISGGFALTHLQVIDQFRFTSHVELVGTFTRDATSLRRKMKSN
ncbi:RsmD family RNA methyltransferase [Alphaproteobacteria bacterium]|jgi:23S rRNA (uracil1939-C5)-methyltransferase|nr:RsmD family RNA methyltransferase [Alphaproteobacteria bacterium]